jgi:hypothetical protein
VHGHRCCARRPASLGRMCALAFVPSLMGGSTRLSVSHDLRQRICMLRTNMNEMDVEIRKVDFNRLIEIRDRQAHRVRLYVDDQSQ